jgi:hypothetical protein
MQSLAGRKEEGERVNEATPFTSCERIAVNSRRWPRERGKVCSNDRQSSSIGDDPRPWKCLPHL